jgi:exonuclease VII large subunit
MSALFPPPGVKVLAIGELTRAVKQLLEEGVGTVWVEGEVSNLSRPNSGHLYLTLKDDEAPLRIAAGSMIATTPKAFAAKCRRRATWRTRYRR